LSRTAAFINLPLASYGVETGSSEKRREEGKKKKTCPRLRTFPAPPSRRLGNSIVMYLGKGEKGREGKGRKPSVSSSRQASPIISLSLMVVSITSNKKKKKREKRTFSPISTTVLFPLHSLHKWTELENVTGVSPFEERRRREGGREKRGGLHGFLGRSLSLAALRGLPA